MLLDVSPGAWDSYEWNHQRIPSMLLILKVQGIISEVWGFTGIPATTTSNIYSGIFQFFQKVFV